MANQGEDFQTPVKVTALGECVPYHCHADGRMSRVESDRAYDTEAKATDLGAFLAVIEQIVLECFIILPHKDTHQFIGGRNWE